MTEGVYCINTIICTKDYTIYAGNDSGEVFVWNFKEDRETRKKIKIDSFGVTSLIMTSNSHILLSSKNYQISLCDSELVNISTGSGHEDEVNCMKLNKAEDKIFTGSSDQDIRIWTLTDDYIEDYRVIKEIHKSAIVVLEVLENLFISGDHHGVFIQWNMEDYEVIKKICLEEPFRCITKTSDNRYIFTADESTEKIKIKIWNISKINEDKEKPFVIVDAHMGFVNSMVFLDKAGKLVSCGMDKLVKIWNFNSTSQESALLTKENISCMCLIKGVLIYSKSKMIKFCSLPEGKKIKNLFVKTTINHLAVDSQSSIIAHDSPENIVYV